MSYWLGPWAGGRGDRGDWDIDRRRSDWDDLDRRFESPFFDYNPFRRDVIRGGGGGAAVVPHPADIDWLETDSAHIFRADLPGVKREELKVEVEDGNVLCICAERVVEEEEGSTGTSWHRAERRRGTFSRRFRLPENAKVEETKSWLDHGVLTVEVPKEESPARPATNVRYIDIA